MAKKIIYPDYKEKLFRLIRKYRKDYSWKEFLGFYKRGSLSVWFDVMNEPPKNPKSRKDADLMQSLYFASLNPLIMKGRMNKYEEKLKAMVEKHRRRKK